MPQRWKMVFEPQMISRIEKLSRSVTLFTNDAFLLQCSDINYKMYYATVCIARNELPISKLLHG